MTSSIVTKKHEVWRLAIGGAKQEADQGPKNLRATTATQAAGQEEVRRAEPVRQEDLAKAGVAENSSTAGSSGLNRVDIKPLKKTYIKVVVDNEEGKPAFERWISPADGTVEFRGQHIAVRVLDRDAVQIRKNGKLVAENDADVTIE